MLRKICLILAIVAGLAAAVVNFAVVKGKVDTLTNDRNDQRTQKETAQRDLASTKKTLKKTQDTLAQTQSDLADSKKAQQIDEDNLAKDETQISDLKDKLSKTTDQLNNTQDQLAAYKATGLTPPEVDDLNKNLKSAQEALEVAKEENLLLSHRVATLNNQLEDILGTNRVVTLPAGLKGTVMAVDPKWEFVVVNVGEDQGVLQNGELLVSRNGQLVGKVIVRSVQKDRSIANLVPGWQLGDIIEGDSVIPAHPST